MTAIMVPSQAINMMLGAAMMGGMEDGGHLRVMMCKSAYVIKHANTWRIEETLELSSAICRGHGTKDQTCARMKNMGVFVFF